MCGEASLLLEGDVGLLMLSEENELLLFNEVPVIGELGRLLVG